MTEDIWFVSRHGDVGRLSQLILECEDLNQLQDGESPLYLASTNGHVECVKLLLEHGANVDLASKIGGTPLMRAASEGQVECVKLLLERGANVDLASKNGKTPLSSASTYNRVECVKLLLERGANVDLADRDGDTALCSAAAFGYVECVKLLLERGANVDLADMDGSTPMCSASRYDHVKCVKLLLEHGANVDLADMDGDTPLTRAATYGHLECVKLLLEHGANVDLASKDGDSALCSAATYGHLKCVKWLLEHGANVDLANKSGDTPWILAWNGKCGKFTECMIEILACGAKVNYRVSVFGSSPYSVCDKEGRSALHVAIERGRSKKIILRIIEAYPKSAEVRDKNGMTPLYIAIKCGADDAMWLLLQHQSNNNNKDKDEFPLLYVATRMTNRTIQSVHIHLIGHGYAGKTTCRLALNKTLKHLNPIMFGVLGNHKDVSVDRSSDSGRTEGMEMDSIESSHHIWLIRDYGGQEEFHVNHARFLSVPGSIYVVVVALWDAEKQCRFSVEEVKNRYLYWLKFLNSIAEKGMPKNCITLINFGEKVGKQHSAVCVATIKQCYAEWQSTESSVKLHGEPCSISVCKVSEVRHLNDLLQMVANSTKDENSIPVLRYIDAIETSFSQNVRLLDSRMDRKSKFVASVCLPAIALLSSASSPSDSKHVEFVCDKMIEYLCASGKIIVVPTSTLSDDPLIVLDINWLSKELLGILISKLSESGRDEFVLTAKEINTMTNKGSDYFGGVDGLVSFLESIGACISVNRDDSSTEIKRWFPLCGQKKFIVGEECVAMVKETWNTFRKVVRLFKLSDPVHQMFPSGYFIDLFLKILSSFTMKSASTVKVFINGMEVKYQFADTRLQIVLVVLDDRCSFTLEVSYASRLATSASFSKEDCWKRFIDICEIIMNPKEVYAAKDIIRVSPWFDNVKLTELFVNPTNEALIKAQQHLKKSNSMDVKEVRNTKSLADLLEDRDEALQNLYILGCDESDMPVSDKNTPPHILELIVGKVDKLQQQLNERWNTVTVSVSSDLIQESFNVMMNTLKDSMSTELHDMITASSRQAAMSEDCLSVSQLQSVVDKLRSDISEKITSENAQVLTELNQAQKSMKELTDDVHNIQHLNDKELQSSILKAFNESKALHRIDNMMQTVVKGTSDVPTMAIVIPVANKGSLLTSFNPSDWTSNEYSLYFVCSHSHQVVTCGPDGKGYRFRRAKEWFKKVAPVIKVCLIAAKIALTISGIPIPINGIVESLDQITAVAETTNYLNSALSIVDAASDVADTFGIAVGSEGSGLDDKSVDNAEQYVKSLDALLKQSDSIEAYKSLKALLDEVDPTLSSVGVEKVTSESGKTGWVKKGDQAVMDSFMRDEKWSMRIDELKGSYNEAIGAATPTEGQSRLGARSGLWLPKSLFGNKNK